MAITRCTVSVRAVFENESAVKALCRAINTVSEAQENGELIDPRQIASDLKAAAEGLCLQAGQNRGPRSIWP